MNDQRGNRFFSHESITLGKRSENYAVPKKTTTLNYTPGRVLSMAIPCPWIPSMIIIKPLMNKIF